jgi:hypothetical protein
MDEFETPSEASAIDEDKETQDHTAKWVMAKCMERSRRTSG